MWVRRVRQSPAFALIGATGVLACSSDSTGASNITPPPPAPPSADTMPLRVLAAARGLQLGSAVDRGFRYAGADGIQFRRVLAREFNVLTPENNLKHSGIHPARSTYRFEPADSLVTFAEANGMRVRGHTLVWHQQLAGWLTSGTWTAPEARTLLHEHITSVVTHYRGRIFAWDVVNEALNDDGSNTSRVLVRSHRARVAQNYRDVVQTCMQNSACNVVVFWGFTDRESWVPGTFAAWGDALIFDAVYQPKPAFTALYNLLK